MGIAIPIMHYTGMAAVTYTPMDTSPDLSYAIDISALANTAVILITLIMLAAVFLIHRWPALAGVMPEPQTHPKT
jgi:NO-binding membrane sensor protein with MHYT domain